MEVNADGKVEGIIGSKDSNLKDIAMVQEMVSEGLVKGSELGDG